MSNSELIKEIEDAMEELDIGESQRVSTLLEALEEGEDDE